jgi:hypothetical protein
MSQPEPEPTAQIEIGAEAEVIPAEQVAAEQAEPEEEGQE